MLGPGFSLSVNATPTLRETAGRSHFYHNNGELIAADPAYVVDGSKRPLQALILCFVADQLLSLFILLVYLVVGFRKILQFICVKISLNHRIHCILIRYLMV